MNTDLGTIYKLCIHIDGLPGTMDDVAFTWARPPKDAWKSLSDLPPNEAQMAYDRLSQSAEITAQGTLRIHFA